MLVLRTQLGGHGENLKLGIMTNQHGHRTSQKHNMVDSGDIITAQEWQHIFSCARCICHIADNGWDRMVAKTWSSILGTLQQLPCFQKFHFNCPKPSLIHICQYSMKFKDSLASLWRTIDKQEKCREVHQISNLAKSSLHYPDSSIPLSPRPEPNFGSQCIGKCFHRSSSWTPLPWACHPLAAAHRCSWPLLWCTRQCVIKHGWQKCMF